MAKLYNLARMTTATIGTGTITLGSAVSGFLSFSTSGVQNGDTVTYAISEGANSEIGRGVYTASGTTLTRTVLKSTNSNTAISLNGNAQVFITVASEDIIVFPATSTDKALVRFNGTGGGTVQDSGITIDDVNAISAVAISAAIQPIGQGAANTKYDLRFNKSYGGTEGSGYYYMPLLSEVKSVTSGTIGLVALAGYAQSATAQRIWGLNTNAVFATGTSATIGYSIEADITNQETGASRGSGLSISGTGNIKNGIDIDRAGAAATDYYDYGLTIKKATHSVYVDVTQNVSAPAAVSALEIWNGATSLLYMKADGTIGVGTTAPTSGSIIDVVGTIQADTLRIDVTPTAVGTGAKTISSGADSSLNLGHYFSINLNGTVYYVPCGTVALT